MKLLSKLISMALIACSITSCTKVTLEEVTENGEPIPPEEKYEIKVAHLYGTWKEANNQNNSEVYVFKNDTYYVFGTGNVMPLEPGVYVNPVYMLHYYPANEYETNFTITTDEWGNETMITYLDATTMKTSDEKTYKKVISSSLMPSSLNGLCFNMNAVFPGIYFNDQTGNLMADFTFLSIPEFHYETTGTASAFLTIYYTIGTNWESDRDRYVYNINLNFIGSNVGKCDVTLTHSFQELDFAGYTPYYKTVTYSSDYPGLTFMFQ